MTDAAQAPGFPAVFAKVAIPEALDSHWKPPEAEGSVGENANPTKFQVFGPVSARSVIPSPSKSPARSSCAVPAALDAKVALDPPPALRTENSFEDRRMNARGIVVHPTPPERAMSPKPSPSKSPATAFV